MSNTINTLTDTLFNLMSDLKSKNIDPAIAKEMNSTASNILQAGKLQIETLKLMKTKKNIPTFLGVEGTEKLIEAAKVKKDLYDQKVEFAQSLGYDGYSAAISAMKKEDFERRFKNEYQS